MTEERVRGLKALGWDDLARTSVSVGFCAAVLAIADLYIPDTVSGSVEWASVSSVAILCWLGFTYARFQIGWAKAKAAEPAVMDRSKVSGNFPEQFAYLVAALCTLCVVAFAQSNTSSVWPWTVNLSGDSTQMVVFCLAIFVSFIPLLAAFWTHDSFVRDGQYLDCVSSDHISDWSTWISLLILGLLSCLAWAAGKKLIDLSGWYGPAVMCAVVCIFLLFILSSSFIRMRLQRQGGNQFAAAGLAIGAGKIASVVDTWFALRLAPLTGATQGGRIPPHVFLLTTFLPLTIMGYALRDGWGLLPIGLAFVLAVSLGRRWAWVETDRETAMRIQKTRGRGIKIGFGNDLRDEALLGYAFLFVLVPLALRQIQMIAAPFEFENGAQLNSATLTDWAAFFGTELAKAVPIVDWADIYGLDNNSAIQANSESARHLVFFSRLLVDAIIIAALLQAWSIMQRNKSQRQLFNSGQLDLLDPFSEETLFKNGLNRRGEITDQLKKTFKERVSATKELYGREIPYNQNRLNELVDSDELEQKIVALYLVQKYELLAGSTFSRMKQLRKRWDRAKNFHWSCPNWIRNQRLDFEKLMDEAQDERRKQNAYDAFPEDQCKDLGALLAHVVRQQEFVNAKDAALELLGDVSASIGPYPAVVTLAGRLFEEDQIPKAIANAITEPVSTWKFAREPLQERRAAAVSAIGRIYNSARTPKATKKLCFEILDWVQKNESQKPVAVAEAALINEVAVPVGDHLCAACQDDA